MGAYLNLADYARRRAVYYASVGRTDCAAKMEAAAAKFDALAKLGESGR